MKRFLSALMVLSTVLLWGCSSGESQPEAKRISVDAMSTFMTLTVYGAEDEVLQAAADEIHRLDGVFSVTDENSGICRLNRDKKAELPDEAVYVINTALNIAEKTEGALDITVYPVVKEWGFTTGDYKIPSRERLDGLLENVDWKKVIVSGNTVSIDENAEIDLGSIVKGYTGDVLAEMLMEAGVQSAILDLGGNIQAVGSKPDGSPWRVAVRDPKNDGGMLGVLSVENKAVITSGDYERNFTGEDGNLYWHIIDPETGFPAKGGISSVTVVCEKGIEGDGLSTSLFVMGLEDAAEYWRENGGFEAVIAATDGRIYVTEGLEDSFRPESGLAVQIIKRQ